MRYFLDTEFNEDFTKPLLGKPRHFIDLISIGLAAEDGRTYYAVSKDFDIDAAYNKYQLEENKYDLGAHSHFRKYWLRDNVLKKIYDEFVGENPSISDQHYLYSIWGTSTGLKEFKRMLKEHGKTTKQIADEIFQFVNPCFRVKWNSTKTGSVYQFSAIDGRFPTGIEIMDHDITGEGGTNYSRPKFYGYYADYDWVLFCSLYGTMMNLPVGFPMYCIDVKQAMVENGFTDDWRRHVHPDPKGEHNALVDAIWTLELHRIITSPDRKAEVSMEGLMNTKTRDNLHAAIDGQSKKVTKPTIFAGNQIIETEEGVDISKLENIPPLSKEELKTESEKWYPKNMYEAVWHIVMQMNDEYSKRIRKGEISQEEFVEGNHQWGGLHIRNEWFLHWTPNHGFKGWPKWKPEIVAYFNAIGITHADDMSKMIFTNAYKVLRGQSINLPEAVTPEQVQWLKEQAQLQEQA